MEVKVLATAVIFIVLAELILYWKRREKNKIESNSIPDWSHSYPPVPPKKEGRDDIKMLKFFNAYYNQVVGRVNGSNHYYPVIKSIYPDYLELRTPDQLEREELMELLRFLDDRANNLIEPEYPTLPISLDL